MFRLTQKEWKIIRSQIVTASQQTKRNTTVTPFVFTERGVTMLASVLKSKKAIKMNIAIIEAFIALKEFALNYKELAAKIEKLEHKHNRQFADIYEALELLLQDKQTTDDWHNRKKIGYKT